jgi:hypothetical protein
VATCDYCGQRSGWFGANKFAQQHRICEDRWNAVALAIREGCVSPPGAESSAVDAKQARESAAAQPRPIRFVTRTLIPPRGGPPVTVPRVPVFGPPQLRDPDLRPHARGHAAGARTPAALSQIQPQEFGSSPARARSTSR